MTLGHEIAGVVEQAGTQVTNVKAGDRVGLHYNITCGECSYCTTGNEQFCSKVRMLGHYTDGGYAEYIAIPARNAVLLPDENTFRAGRDADVRFGHRVPYIAQIEIEGGGDGRRLRCRRTGHIGPCSLQRLSALDVFAIDINPDKLKLAAQYGAIPVNAKTNRRSDGDPATHRRPRVPTWRSN